MDNDGGGFSEAVMQVSILLYRVQMLHKIPLKFLVDSVCDSELEKDPINKSELET